MGVDAEIKAGPWLGDTRGFNNHFILCTRDWGRDWDWGWAGGREGTILDAKGAGRRDRNQGNIYLYRYSNIDHISPARPAALPNTSSPQRPGPSAALGLESLPQPPSPRPHPHPPQSSGPRSPESGRRGRRGLGRPVLSVRRRRRQQSGEGGRRAGIPGSGGAGGRGPCAARAREALVPWGALVQRGARRWGGGVQRRARRLGPRIYRFRAGRLGAQVTLQRGEELGSGGRAGVVREGRQAKQALAEAGQVAAGERLGVLGWGPGNT